MAAGNKRFNGGNLGSATKRRSSRSVKASVATFAIDRLEPRCLFASVPLDIVRSIPFDSRTKATYVDITGDTVTISLKGPGSGLVQFDTNETANASQIVLQDTTQKSSLSVKGDTSAVGLTVTGSLKSISASKFDLVGGPFSVSGTIRSISIRGLSDVAFTVGAGDALSMSAGDIFDSSFTVPSGIKSLKVNTWNDTDEVKDSITTTILTSLSSKGSLGASVFADSVGTIKVKGDLTGDVRTTGDIKSISSAAYTNVSIFAAVTSGFTGLPAALTDFVNPTATIKSISVTGKFASAIGGTNIAAPIIKKASLAAVLTVNSGIPCGIAADQIDSIAGAYDQSEKFKFKKLTDPTQTVTRNDFTIRVL